MCEFCFFKMVPVLESTLIGDFGLMDVAFCAETMCVCVSRAAERWTCLTCEHGLTLETSCDCICEEAVGRPGGTSWPLRCGGCLLCGYNMVGQVYCVERGCAVVLLRLWAGKRYIWRTTTLTSWKWSGEKCSRTQLELETARNKVYNCIFVSAV